MDFFISGVPYVTPKRVGIGVGWTGFSSKGIVWVCSGGTEDHRNFTVLLSVTHRRLGGEVGISFRQSTTEYFLFEYYLQIGNSQCRLEPYSVSLIVQTLTASFLSSDKFNSPPPPPALFPPLPSWLYRGVGPTNNPGWTLPQLMLPIFCIWNHNITSNIIVNILYPPFP